MTAHRFAVVTVAAVLFSGVPWNSDTPAAYARASRDDSRPLPPPVRVRSEPDGVTLADPAFRALPNARAAFGRLAGSVYQIEIPARWNGRLVLFMHGYGELRPQAAVSPPGTRRYLVGQGYAWAASSFSSTSMIPGRAADETAALWDFFARRYGRPTRAYVTGISMGGMATHIAAERYANRFDGALALCGSAGLTPAVTSETDFFVAGAFAAGVTQAEFDASPDIGRLVRERIRPALRDPRTHGLFENIAIDLTGGPRMFDREGFRLEEDTNWQRATLLVAGHIAPNPDRRYRLGLLSGVTSEEFNRGAIRIRANTALSHAFLEGNDITGNLQMPLLTLHSTGDWQVPIDATRVLQRRVDAAGKHDLIVQRVMRDPSHCGFTNTEWEAGLESVVAWAERGVRPEGTDVDVRDFRTVHPTFELLPRPGTPEAARVPGAGDRVTLHGRLTIDGAPFDATYLGAVVQRDGLITPCQWTLSRVQNGSYETTVLADEEGAGCGAPGADIVLWTFAHNRILYSSEALRWPAARLAVFDAGFSTAGRSGSLPPFMGLAGEAFRTDGHQLPAGTRIEAFVGSTRCGVASVRRTGDYSGFSLDVAGPDSVPGCLRGATVAFRVDGRPALDTIVNESGSNTGADLTLR